jgi:hypothetical protein
MSHTSSLDYAPRPRAAYRLLRRAYWLVAAVGIAAAACLWGPPAWRWAQFLYWQHQCLTYAMPPGHLVFDYDVPYLESAAALTRFEKLGGETRYWQNATIFLHEMRSPDGSPWLISLSCCYFPPAGQFTVMQEARRPQHFVGRSTAQYLYREIPFQIADKSPGLRVFAAQTDVANPIHLTFEYEVSRRKHIMDAWLKDTGEMVLSPRP